MSKRRPTLPFACLALSGAVALAGLSAPGAQAAPLVAAPESSAAPQTAARASAAASGLARRESRAADRAEVAARARLPLGSRDATAVNDTMLDRDGSSHVRLARTYGGLDVVGADVVVHQGPRGQLRSISGSSPRIGLSTRPTVAAQAASRTASRSVSFTLSSAQPRRDLVVLALSGKPRLAWRVDVRGTRRDGSPAGENVFVAARGPAGVIAQWPSVLAESGTGNSLYSGTVALDTVLGSNGIYSLVDPVRGASRTTQPTGRRANLKILRDADNVWGNGRKSDPKSAAVDAHFGAAQTWDYYLENFGRVGIRDDGVGATSVVHAGRFTNAFWDDQCFCMTYGDGSKREKSTPLVTLDVAGHEMTHGVTSATAGLIYEGESGGLNEATSDIMATNVEFAAGNVAPGTDVGDYLIGEEVFHYADESKNYLRRMDQPSLDGYSQDCVNKRTERIDVHFSSGPANHFYYLLAEGSGAKTINGVDYDSPTCNNAAVVGIGREAAEKIWYRGLTTYMTPRTDYRGAKRATTTAARDLYGVGSTEVATVKAAWASVDVP